MGKKLVIKGANFSENAIVKQEEWYTELPSGISYTGTFNPAYCFTTDNMLTITGKVVNVIRIGSTVSSGFITLCVIQPITMGSASIIKSITIEVPEINEPIDIELQENIEILEGQGLFVNSDCLEYKVGGSDEYYEYNKATNVLRHPGGGLYMSIAFGKVWI